MRRDPTGGHLAERLHRDPHRIPLKSLCVGEVRGLPTLRLGRDRRHRGRRRRAREPGAGRTVRDPATDAAAVERWRRRLSGGGGGGGGGGSRADRRGGPSAPSPSRTARPAPSCSWRPARARRSRAAAAATPPATTTPPPATTAETPRPRQAAATTVAAPATDGAGAGHDRAGRAAGGHDAANAAAAASSGGDDSGTPDLPRDGLVVLIGVLLLGLAVALRAIRARERRIGWALLGFCVVYLLALAGLVTGVAGAAIANPASFAVTAGDGETLLTFDAPPAGLALVVRRATGAVPPASCATANAGLDRGPRHRQPVVDAALANGTAYSYRACLTGAGGDVVRLTASATPSRASTRRAPRPVGGALVRAGSAAASRSAGATGRPRLRGHDRRAQVRLGADVAQRRQGRLHAATARRCSTTRSRSPGPLRRVRLDEDDNAAAAVRRRCRSFDPPLRTPFDRSA